MAFQTLDFRLAVTSFCRVLLDFVPAWLVKGVRSRRRARKHAARGCDVLNSGEQSNRSEMPGCRPRQTGRRPAGGTVDRRAGSAVLSLLRGLLLLSVFLATQAQGAETNSLPSSPGPANRHPAPGSRELAAAHERAGRKREAAELYEAMVRTNNAARKVLAHRLVAIYTETSETNKALAWAREVMRDNPDPHAYLAAVQARLGQWKDAREVLEREVAGNTNTTRAVTLRWQLADVYEKEGDGAKATRVLNEAAGLAKGTQMEAATQRRLKTLKGGTK
jgi:tetratricopeptide (TPR) repeat protein